MEKELKINKPDIRKVSVRKKQFSNTEDFISNAGLWKNRKVTLAALREKTWPEITLCDTVSILILLTSLSSR